MHTSPLVQPGTGDGGGMNVYVRELVASLGQAGVRCQVYTRRWAPDLPDEIDIEPGFRVVHIDAGDPVLPKEERPAVVDTFTDGVLDHIAGNPVDAVHAHYWVSAVSGHTIKHELDIPLVSTFHTLGRVKAAGGDPEPASRITAEDAIVGCSDAIVANAPAEAAHMQIRLDIAPVHATQDVAVSVAFLVTEIVELGMLCGATEVSLVMEREGPGRARLTLETDSLIGQPRCDETIVARFDRIIIGLARQLRSTLDHDEERGRYSVRLATTERSA
jgi:hypothetical protein